MFILFFLNLNIKIKERLVPALFMGRAPGERARPRFLGLVGERGWDQNNLGLIRNESGSSRFLPQMKGAN